MWHSAKKVALDTQPQSKIVEQAKRIAADPSENSAGEQALRKEFDTLLTMLKPADAIDKDDLKIIKEQVFKKLNFWVTDTTPSAEPDGGVLIRGNLRGDMTELFEGVTAAMEAQFGACERCACCTSSACFTRDRLNGLFVHHVHTLKGYT